MYSRKNICECYSDGIWIVTVASCTIHIHQFPLRDPARDYN